MDDYFEAKAALFDGRAERAVICVDDEWGQRLAARVPGRGHRLHHRAGGRLARRRRRARAPTARSPSPRSRPDGVAAAACGCSCPARSTWPTRWSRWPACDAVGCARRGGRRGLRRAWPCPGRMQRVEAGQPFLAVVDYAHKPAAVAALLDTLRAAGAGPADHGAGLRRRPRPRQAPADGRGRRGARPSCSSSPTTTRAPRTRPRSGPRCWPAPQAEPRAAGSAGDRRPAGRDRRRRGLRPTRATPSSSPGKGHETGQEITGVKHPVRRRRRAGGGPHRATEGTAGKR